MTLQEKLDRQKADFESSASPEDLTVMHKATTDLRKSGLREGALKKENVFPHFSLPDQNGKTISSKQLLEKGPLVVNFYRGVW